VGASKWYVARSGENDNWFRRVEVERRIGRDCDRVRVRVHDRDHVHVGRSRRFRSSAGARISTT